MLLPGSDRILNLAEVRVYHAPSPEPPHPPFEPPAPPSPPAPPAPPPAPPSFPVNQCDLITYGSAGYEAGTTRIVKHAKRLGWFRRVRAYSPDQLTPSFRRQFAKVLALRRGAGYWIWKWDILNQSLALVPDGAFLIYLDSGDHIHDGGYGRLLEYFDMLRASPYNNIGFYIDTISARGEASWSPENKYTVPAIFDFYGVQHNRSITDSPQIENNVIIVQNGEHTRRWLHLIRTALDSNMWLTTDAYNDDGHSRGPWYFIEARHDQSLASVTRKMVGTIGLRGWGAELDCWYGGGPFWACRDDGHHD